MKNVYFFCFKILCSSLHLVESDTGENVWWICKVLFCDNVLHKLSVTLIMQCVILCDFVLIFFFERERRTLFSECEGVLY